MYQANREFATRTQGLVRGVNSLPLSCARKGDRLLITDIPEERGRTQLIRLGIMTGEAVQCIEKLPGGTVVVEKNRQEIAIGAALAKTIIVEVVGPEDAIQPFGQ